MKPYTKDDLRAYLDANGIQAEILLLDDPTPTVPDAAWAVGASEEQIVKSVLFMVDGQPVITITCGPENVEQRALAARYGVGRKKVRLANPEQVLTYTNYPVGTVPPFGYPHPLETLIDPTVLAQAEVYAGGGEYNALLRISPQNIARQTGAEVIDLHSIPAEE
jgi:prolyl-tRNA editing enzyme YbaK/EbsC (Cys-tRNA(Pro) deacylase)